jgi:AcrR family transcriptional regulator
VTAIAVPAKRKFKGVAPEERKAERQKRLLEAGLEAFGTRGFHAVGVRDVCALAKLTERYFYESFANREELFLAVYRQAAQRIRDAMIAAHGKVRPEVTTLARAGLEATLSSFRDDPRLARILLLEVFAVGADIGEARLVVSQEFAEEIATITHAMYPNLAEERLSAQIIGNGLYGSTVYIAMRWALDGFREPLDVIVNHCLLFYETLDARMQTRA